MAEVLRVDKRLPDTWEAALPHFFQSRILSDQCESRRAGGNSPRSAGPSAVRWLRGTGSRASA